MTRVFALLAVSMALLGCFKDETVAGYGAADQVWALSELNGKKFDASATLTFPSKGRIDGKAPCNRYSASMVAPYPWFETGPILSTKTACPDLPAESQFFAALSQATLAEVLGGTLILSNTDGLNMVFTTAD